MIKQTIERLLSEQDVNALAENPIVKATKLRYPELQPAPFLECQLILKGGYAMAGVLTAFQGGSLLMVAVAKTPDGKVMLAEHYFGDSEVQAIVVGREMPEQLVRPVARSIVLGH
jgi:hypothetical protein